MRRDNAHHNEDGFTLLELIVVILFAGILAAISAPSFSALNQRNKVTQDLTSAKNALLEAQRSAIRRGQNCQLDFSYDTSTNKSIKSFTVLIIETDILL
jgi:prepilin-type N-terminal cleavage/methylation domain-containing protein